MELVYEIKNLKKSFTSGSGDQKKTHTVLDNFDLKIKEKRFVSIIGPSGCGKSTLLRLMAGLETPNEGVILHKGEKLTGPVKEIGMVFQSYSLMPWLNVYDNIKLGLKFKGIPKEERKGIVDEYLDIIGLRKFKYSLPHELSGGMQQRVAIARTLANDPDVILMDEPFGALDAHTRIQLQRELLKLWEMKKKTIVFVTHSVDEAIYLSDRIIFLSTDKGKIHLDLDVELDRPRDRSNVEYAKLNKKLLDEFESLVIKSDVSEEELAEKEIEEENKT